MEKLSVFEARKLLHEAIGASSAKETELQLMVGSRYHELIESADAIVSMHSTAVELRERLDKLPQSAQFLINAQSTKNEKSNQENNIQVGDKHEGKITSKKENHEKFKEIFFRNVLTIPPRIWNALDQSDFFSATSALIEWPDLNLTKCYKNDDDIIRLYFGEKQENDDNNHDLLPNWLNEFRFYINQFPSRIIIESENTLKKRKYETKDYAGALISLKLINNIQYDSILLLFLKSRSNWIDKAILHLQKVFEKQQQQQISESDFIKIVSKQLRVVIRTLRKTISDIELLFLGESSSRLLLQKTQNDEKKATTTTKGGGGGGGLVFGLVFNGIIELTSKWFQLQSQLNIMSDHSEEVEMISFDEMSEKEKLRKELNVDKIRKETTYWFGEQVLKILDVSQQVLKGATTAGSLANIRQEVWTECTAFKMKNNNEINESKDGLIVDEDWGYHCNACLDSNELAIQLVGAPIRLDLTSSNSMFHHDEINSPCQQYNNDGIDLWNLLFSRGFASLGESLLHSSLRQILEETTQNINLMIDLILSKKTTDESLNQVLNSHNNFNDVDSKSIHDIHSSSTDIIFSSLTSHGLPYGYRAYEILFSSETILKQFEKQLSQLYKDAISLVQEGDHHAQEDVKQSLYLKTVEMISCLINHLRSKNNILIIQSTNILKKLNFKQQVEKEKEFKNMNEKLKMNHLYKDKLEDPSNTSNTSSLSNVMDASLAIGRSVQILINGYCNKTLYHLLTQIPEYYIKSNPDRISMEQLHASFIVTDNNGDGELLAMECSEAIESVLGCGHLLELDEIKMPTITLPEFALFATCILESAQPFHYLKQCSKIIFINSYSNWSKNIIKCLEMKINHKLKIFIKNASQSFHGKTLKNKELYDLNWRNENGLWIEIKETKIKDKHQNIEEIEKGNIDNDKEGDDDLKEANDEQVSSSSLIMPASISCSLQQFLFSASAELDRVISLSDAIQSLDFEHPPTSSSSSLQNKKLKETSIDANESIPKKNETVFMLIRNIIFTDIMKCLSGVYHDISLIIASQDTCIELAIYQLLCDITFIIQWIKHSYHQNSSSSSSITSKYNEWIRRFGNIENALTVYVDPIELKISKPLIEKSAKKFYDCAHISLNILLPVISSSSSSSASNNILSNNNLMRNNIDNEDEEHSSHMTNIIQLAKPVRRFSLYPISMDLANQSSSSPSSSSTNPITSSLSTNANSSQDKFLRQQGDVDGVMGGGFSLLNNLGFKW